MFVLFGPGLSNLFPREKKVTWIKLSKGTGEFNNASPYKKTTNMPKNTLREQKNIKEKTKDKTGSDKKSAQGVKKKPQPSAQKKKKQTSTPIKKAPEDKAIEDALARVQEELKQRQVDLEAAQVEKEGGGQSPEGSVDVTNGETNPEIVMYVTTLKKKINDEWVTLPKANAEGTSLVTVISFQIDAQGAIVTTQVETQSGDVTFDLLAQRAIERAAPFPSPPDIIREVALSEGFSIEFNTRSGVDTGTQ